MSQSFSAIAFLGGMAIFMYGIRLSKIGVQLLAGDRLRSLVASLTDNRVAALMIGILVTLILQSSTATTVMLVGFASTGTITLVQAMGVMLGADIGTTFVVVLLSIRHLTDYALTLLIAGVVLDIVSHRKRRQYISMVLVGFGFVFFGMQLMIQDTVPLRTNPLISEIFTTVGQNPPYAFFAAILFTAFVQNSATTLGLTIALTISGLLNFQEALPIVLGANVGTCAGSLLTSFGGGPSAKRVAVAHLLLKSAGASVAMAFLPAFGNLIASLAAHLSATQNNPATMVALTHVTFNLILTAVFLPFISQGAWLVRKIVPEPLLPEDQTFGPKYLDVKSLETPALAFANAKREILRMAEIAEEMFSQINEVFQNNDRERMAEIEEEDDKVDMLDREVKFYLAKISQESLNPEQARMQLNLVAITSDLEEVCDIINRNILELAEKKMAKGSEFSDDGRAEIEDFHTKITENFQLAISVLASGDEAICRKILRHEKHLADLEDRYREAHLLRLNKGLKETIETSSIHLDLLANFRRVNSKLTAIARAAFPGKELAA